MRTENCLCDLIPELSLQTKVIIIISNRELHVPTNTGRLAVQALTNSILLTRGDMNNPYDLAQHLRPERQSLVLYPADDAEVLSAATVERYGGKIDLVIPDGNWRQTVKMRRRDSVMATLPTIRLSPGEPTEYRVRRERKREGLATIEAVARALGVIEGVAVQCALEQLMNVMVERTLKSRGIRPARVVE